MPDVQRLHPRRSPSLAEHPLPALVAAGVPVTINSDDPPMFATTLNHEYEVAAELLGLDEAGVADLARAAVRASFLDAAGQGALLGEIGRVRGQQRRGLTRLDLCLIRPRTARRQARSRSMPGSTGSATPAAGSSTWERRRAFGSG